MARQKCPSYLKSTKKIIHKAIGLTNYSDVYDFISPMVDFSYNLAEFGYAGHIMDKKGNFYEVYASANQCDQGRIAGGGMDYRVVINYNGSKIILNGHFGVFSKGYGTKIISDLREGYHLEDYLQKNKDCCRSRDLVNEIIKGNEYEERSFAQIKHDEFYAKYKRLGYRIELSVTEDETTFVYKGKNEVYTMSKDVAKAVNDLISLYEFVPTDFKGTKLYVRVNSVLGSNVEFGATNKGEIVFIDTKKLIKKSNEKVSAYIGNFNRSESKKFKEVLNSKEYKEWKPTSYEDLTLSRFRGLANTIAENKAQKAAWKNEAKSAKVTIKWDNKAHKLRAIADDGVHGENNVSFPNELRTNAGDEYMVEYLIWNGKNYRVKGNIEKI